MKKGKVLWTLLTIVLTTGLPAQRLSDDDGAEPEALRRLLIPPDLIMRHQADLKLSADQEETIRAQVLEAQARFTDLRWSLQRELAPLLSMIEDSTVPESEVLSQMDKVLDLEREMKKTRLLMALRIKSVLSLEQLSRLREIQKRTGFRARLGNRQVERPLEQP